MGELGQLEVGLGLVNAVEPLENLARKLYSGMTNLSATCRLVWGKIEQGK